MSMNATTAAVVRSRLTELGPTDTCVELPVADAAHTTGVMVVSNDVTVGDARITNASRTSRNPPHPDDAAFSPRERFDLR